MNNKLLLMLPTIIKAEPTSDSDHQEHLTILIASGKRRKWFDKISLMSKGKNYWKAQEWGSFTSHLHSMSYKMEITEDEQAVADVTNYHQGWTHKWFRSSRASNYSHCKWKAKKMIWQDLKIKSRDFLRKMLRSTSRDVRPHYQHGLVMVMWKRFSNSYARHWLIFSLLMKVNFPRTWIKTSWLRENSVLLSTDWVWTMESTWQA